MKGRTIWYQISYQTHDDLIDQFMRINGTAEPYPVAEFYQSVILCAITRLGLAQMRELPLEEVRALCRMMTKEFNHG